MSKQNRSLFFVGLMVLGIGLIAAYFLLANNQAQMPRETAAGAATATPESFLLPFPTKTPTAAVTPTAGASPRPPLHALSNPATIPVRSTGTAAPAAAPETATAVAPTTIPPLVATTFKPKFRERFGSIGGNSYLIPALEAGLPLGHFMNWRVDPTQPLQAGLPFWHMVRLGPGDGVRTDWAVIDQVLAEQQGSIWIIGNEPDVLVQDSLTPQTYARLYHELYTYIKERDPAAIIAIAGVAQPTPLRQAYLDAVLDSYKTTYGAPMPIDIWTIHAFILREEAGSWGVGIPPGMSADGARLYEISDHGNIEILKQNLIDFRDWMAARGYGDRPLAVTEYGIVMPHDYGYPPERVAEFLTQSFDFLLSATSNNGYAPDGNRLVQWWSWFSLYEAQEGYGTGNLYDPETRKLTPLGEEWAAYVNN